MAQAPIRLDLSYHSAGQEEIFECTARYVVAPCGRRYGKTEGAFRRMVDFALLAEGSSARQVIPGRSKSLQLWVDVTQGNIERYFGRYLEPMLKAIVSDYKWNKQLKILTFSNGSVVHFGSAEEPKNLEGFGYDIVWLNEAGHILGGPKGEKLWASTILPMIIEGRGGKGAQVFFLGTPKDIQYGPGLFRKMALRGENPDDKEARVFRRSSYDNPYLTPALIKEIFLEVQPNEVRQEIFGDFEDQAGLNMVVRYDVAMGALERKPIEQPEYHVIWGVDVARGGADDTALCKRRGRTLLDSIKTRNDLTDGNQVANWIEEAYLETPEEDRPKWIIIDEIGYGSSALDASRKKGLPVRGFNSATKPVSETYAERRTELWFKAAKWCETGSLADNQKLVAELILPSYRFKQGTQRIRLETKDELKKRGHRSPNRADAFVFTFEAGNELRPTGAQLAKQRRNWIGGETTWMST